MELKLLLTALLKAKKELKDVTLLKTKENPYFNSLYIPLEDVLELVEPVLFNNGLLIAQTFTKDTTLKTTLYHCETGTSIESEQPLIIDKNNAQGFASASTYARRYGILSILNLAAEDDDGNNAVKKPDNRQDKPTEPTAKQRYESIIARAGKDQKYLKITGDVINKYLTDVNKNIIECSEKDYLNLITAIKGALKEGK